MTKIYAKHLPYENGHLGYVTDEMRLTGAPTIRCMKFNGKLCAVEGSHRLASAYHLDLPPKIVILEADEVSDDMNAHWEGVTDGLPVYEYDFAFVLDLNKI